MKFALITVFDKTDIIELAVYLVKSNYTILSTSGTAAYLKENSIPVLEIQNYTNFPEILSGRVKTIHPKIFGGILCRPDNENDMKEIKEHNINLINLVIVNFYPFKKIVKEKKKLNDIIECIDIGGIALARAAAKNFQNTIILTSPEQYYTFMSKNENFDFNYRKKNAVKAFKLTSKYDKFIYKTLKRDEN